MKKIVLSLLGVLVVSISVFMAYAFSRLDYSDLHENHTLTNLEEVESGELSVQWLGNTNVVVSDGKHSIMTDGWFTRTRLNPINPVVQSDIKTIQWALEKSKINNLVAVLPIHSHFDHVMDAPAVAEATGAIMMGSESSANVARGWGLDEDQIFEVGQRGTLTLGDFKITMIRTNHYEFVKRFEPPGPQTIAQPLVQPAKVNAYREGGAYAVWIEHPQGNVLINGSAGFVPGALDDVEADLVFLGVAGVGVQSPEYQQQYWQEVVATTRANIVVPVHWDSMIYPLSDKPQPPTRLMDELLLYVKMKESVYWLLEKEEVYTPILPMWKKVAYRQLVAGAEKELARN
ncbi:MAG: MBL fold metallo-hydrolase [Agarilytica sp.]